MRHRRLRVVCAALAISGPAPGPAADLIEPWDVGLSNLELHVERSQADDFVSLCAVAGFGLGSGLSLGVLAQRSSDRVVEPGVFAAWTTPLGPGGDVDLFVETLRGDPGDDDQRWGGTAGLEWTAPESSTRPYARLAADRDAGDWTPRLQIGVVVPASDRLDLHFEAGAGREPTGRTTFELAVGPNLRLGPRAELITELRFTRDGPGVGAASVAMGITVDPRPLS